MSSSESLLLRNADVLVTMDDGGAEIPDGGLFARDGWIEQVGPTSDLPDTADEVIDCRGSVVIPGLVNTHHHFFQTLTRTLAQDSELFGWLVELYPVWSRLTPEHVRVSTATALAELALSGCTTAFDHHYFWINGASIDDQIRAARKVGIRFHASRGSMSVGQSAGGLPPDEWVEDEDAILADCQRAVSEYHDPSPGAMTRVVIAPCSPFTVSPDLMRQSAALARSVGVKLHTHLAETLDEEDYCLELFGSRPVEYAESVDWLGPDVWFAHAVHVSERDTAAMASTRTGVGHCPTSNMRLASGVAPLTRYLQAGVPVGLGVDGSASNDSSHLLAEARQALLAARMARAMERSDEPMLTARLALRVATRGGAEVLGRTDIGSLEPGKAADVACFRTDGVSMAGAHDPVAGLVLSGPHQVDRLIVGGRSVVVDGQMVGMELGPNLERHRQLARLLVT
ncbi:MAG: 8-oxoguanine deaminase [bacterium]|nr:8-oxoguanine deaminase [bacterium]